MPPGRPVASIAWKPNTRLAGPVEDPRPFQAVRPDGLRPYTCPAPGSRGTNGGGRCQGAPARMGVLHALRPSADTHGAPAGVPEAVQGAEGTKRCGGGSVELLGGWAVPESVK